MRDTGSYSKASNDFTRYENSELPERIGTRFRHRRKDQSASLQTSFAQLVDNARMQVHRLPLEFSYNATAFRIDFTPTDGPLGNGDYRLKLAAVITDVTGYARSFTIDAIPDGVVFDGRDNGEYTRAASLVLEAEASGSGCYRFDLLSLSLDDSNQPADAPK